MFFDEVKINVKSGDGGDGCVAFRREKYVPFGGPAGGNGGPGGGVYLVVDRNLNTLVHFKRRVHFKAERGGRGGGKNQQGKAGEDRLVPVPPGTVVYDADSGELQGDLVEDGQRLRVVRGGRGGRGNAAFATPTNQAPRVAEHGEPGQERSLRLEMKLIADVGVIGMPNAGKSTLLSVVSAARPKIADYPFTTLQPNLGVVTVDDYHTFVMADVPGLIPGASEGAGLGHQFLRHVERTRLLIHLLDGAAADPLADYAAINRELAQFSAQLAQRPQIVVLNKMDLPDTQDWWPLVQEAMREQDAEAYAISAVSQQGVKELMQRTFALLQTLPPPGLVPEEIAIFRPAEDDENAFAVEQEEDGWRVRGVRAERIAAMTPFALPEAAARFQRQLRAMGVVKALEEAGVHPGDLVRVGEIELEWQGCIRKLGILGGTFDPVHHGHLVAAGEVHQQLGLDLVLFAPVGEPPHKPSRPISPVEHRLRMVELAIAGKPHFALSRVDADRPGPCYTADTLGLLRAEWGPQSEFFFIVGSDSFRDILTWRQPQRIVELCELAVAERPGSGIDLPRLQEALPGLAQRLHRVPMPLLEISSSDLRRRVRRGRPIAYLTPPTVEAYILEHGLYR